MRRWDWEGGGIVFAIMLVVAIAMVAVSIAGRMLQALGLF